VHLVGFIIRIYHDERSPERQTGKDISFWSVCKRECYGKLIVYAS